MVYLHLRMRHHRPGHLRNCGDLRRAINGPKYYGIERLTA
jgi:hypothetical protein